MGLILFYVEGKKYIDIDDKDIDRYGNAWLGLDTFYGPDK